MSLRGLLVILLVLPVALAGCASAPPAARTLREAHLTLDIPSGWRSSVERHHHRGVYYSLITLDGPGTSLMIYAVYDRVVSASLREFADRSEEFGGSATITGFVSKRGEPLSVGGVPCESIEQEFDDVVLGARVHNRARFVQLTRASRTAFIQQQASVDDWKIVEADFASILAHTRLE
jgi:hypothetical protein